MSFIELQGVTKHYGTNCVLSGIDLTIEHGEFVTIIGPYGSGKSTILKILSGLQSADTGNISINGASPSRALKSRKIGYAFQDANLLPWKSVRDNIAMAQDIASISDKRKVLELLKLGDLENYANHNIEQLSGGMRQILGILRALVLEPDLLILDEPLASIDEVSREKFQKTLRRIHAETKKTTVMVTHSLQEAVYLSDRVIVLTKKPTEIGEVLSISEEDKKDIYSEKFYTKVRQLRQALTDA